MSEIALTVKNATADTKSLGTILSGSFQYPGHYNKAVIEGGATPYRNLDVGETGAVVKASAGQIYGGIAFNLYGATPSGLPTLYLKIYDKATTPTSSDTPKFTLPIESGEPLYLNEICGVTGIAFANGIGVRCTLGLADNSTSAPPTNSCVLNLSYA